MVTKVMTDATETVMECSAQRQILICHSLTFLNGHGPVLSCLAFIMFRIIEYTHLFQSMRTIYCVGWLFSIRFAVVIKSRNLDQSLTKFSQSALTLDKYQFFQRTSSGTAHLF